MSDTGLERVVYARACPFCGATVDPEDLDSMGLSGRDSGGAVAMFTAHRRCLENVMTAGSRRTLPQPGR